MMRALLIFSQLILASCSCSTFTPTATFKTVLIKRDDHPSVTTLGAPSNGHQSGDIIIVFSEPDNKVLDQIISQNVCPDSKLRKRFLSDCFSKNGEAIYGSMRNGNMPGLIELANNGIELPLPPRELDGGVTMQFGQMGDGLPGLDRQARDRLGRIVWWAQYPALVFKVSASNPVKIIPALVATRIVTAPAQTTTRRCHYRDRIPYCANCGGFDGNLDRETCVGFGDLWKMCPCLKRTPMPPNKDLHEVDKSILQSILKEWKGSPEVTCLGTATTQDIGAWSKMAMKACEGTDLSKTFLKDGMTIADIGSGSQYSALRRYKYMFRWEPTVNEHCSKSCEDIFLTLSTRCGKESKSEMAKTGASKSSCGTASYKIEDNLPLDIACRGKSFSAPRGDKESNGATSLDRAIEQFCADNDSKSVKKGNDIYQRYGITEYGVKERRSFWVRGSITCGEEAHMRKSDCIEALKYGMDQCDHDSGYSHGLAASIGCLDYSIDLSGVTRDDSPPWSQKLTFPPPEDAERPDGSQHAVECLAGSPGVRNVPYDDDELDEALDAFCQNGAEIRGLGTKSPYADRLFEWNSWNGKYMVMGTILNNDKGAVVNDKDHWTPYKDMRWCDNYDWKMGKDDCTYALRKMHKVCTRDKGLEQGDYTYRCVRYSYGYPPVGQ